MREHIVFTLAASLGATGEFAGHERRGSVGWPGRSAILGLVAAALGIRRHETGRLAVLDALKVAVAVFDEGEPLRDYHTVMTIPTAKAKRPDSRRAAFEMAKGDINTAITIRDYRTSPLFGVALWGGELESVLEALKSPAFVLYLGRKSCPLAAPMRPRITNADTPVEALQEIELPPWYAQAEATRVYSDPYEQVPMNAIREQRHDVSIDREKWHFAPREVLRLATNIVARGLVVP
jgi:CRISPR system Cascade subunit CasD